MPLTTYTAQQFAQSKDALLPPGPAWRWKSGGLGESLLWAMSQEPPRLCIDARQMLWDAIALHTPASTGVRWQDYLDAARSAIDGYNAQWLDELRPFHVGSRVGQRTWSASAQVTLSASAFASDPVYFEAPVTPLRVGFRVGARCWSHRSRYILWVRYHDAFINAASLLAALDRVRQAHVWLWMTNQFGVTYGSH